MKNIVILISGRGSNMASVAKACHTNFVPGKISAVIADRSEAPGLQLARQQNITTHVVAYKTYKTHHDFEHALKEVIDKQGADLILLAGFMRILSAAFVNHYEYKILNIHPSLLPSFPGLNTHQRAIDHGIKIHGATVHFVTANLDQGPVIIQAAVPLYPDDDAKTLAARVLTQEHDIYPQAARWFLQKRLCIQNQRVKLLDADDKSETQSRFAQ